MSRLGVQNHRVGISPRRLRHRRRPARLRNRHPRSVIVGHRDRRLRRRPQVIGRPVNQSQHNRLRALIHRIVENRNRNAHRRRPLGHRHTPRQSREIAPRPRRAAHRVRHREPRRRHRRQPHRHTHTPTPRSLTPRINSRTKPHHRHNLRHRGVVVGDCGGHGLAAERVVLGVRRRHRMGDGRRPAVAGVVHVVVHRRHRHRLRRRPIRRPEHQRERRPRRPPLLAHLRRRRRPRRHRHRHIMSRLGVQNHRVGISPRRLRHRRRPARLRNRHPRSVIVGHRDRRLRRRPQVIGRPVNQSQHNRLRALIHRIVENRNRNAHRRRPLGHRHTPRQSREIAPRPRRAAHRVRHREPRRRHRRQPHRHTHTPTPRSLTPRINSRTKPHHRHNLRHRSVLALARFVAHVGCRPARIANGITDLVASQDVQAHLHMAHRPIEVDAVAEADERFEVLVVEV